MRTAEFDAFGPWVTQVVSAEGLPRLYADHVVDFDTARMVVKVPRNITRRDASPDMHLYDHLLIAGQSELTVLSRREDEYTTTVVPYDRVAAVHTSVVMLDGLLRIYDAGGTGRSGVALDLPYNGVSDDVVGRLARIVRAEALAAAGDRAVVTPEGAPLKLNLEDLGQHDVALVTAGRELARVEGLLTWAAHGRVPVQRRGGVLGVLGKLVFAPTLHAAVVGSTPGEVHVIHRRPWVTTGRKPVHSVAHTAITVPRVERLEVTEHEAFTGTQLVRVVAGAAEVDLLVPTGAPTLDTLLTLLDARPE